MNQVFIGEYEDQVITEMMKKLYLDEKTADVHFSFSNRKNTFFLKNKLKFYVLICNNK